MAEKDHQHQQHVQTIPPPNMNTDSLAAPQPQSEELHRIRRSRTKIITFVILVILCHFLVILSLNLTILHIKTPTYHIKSVTIDNLIVTNSTKSPSFRMRLNASVTIKNNNFGPYKYHDCYMTLAYRGQRVGEGVIEGASAKALSTKTLKVSLNASYDAVGSGDSRLLRSDISSGLLEMNFRSEMRGQVEVLKVVKRKDKYLMLDCHVMFGLVEMVVRDIKCD